MQKDATAELACIPRAMSRLSRLAARLARPAVPARKPISTAPTSASSPASTRTWRRPPSGARSRRSCAARQATACSASGRQGPRVDRTGDVFRHATFAGTRSMAGCSRSRATTTPPIRPRASVRIPLHRRDDPDPQPPGAQEFLDYGLLVSQRRGSPRLGCALAYTRPSNRLPSSMAASIAKIIIPDDFNMPEAVSTSARR